MAVQGIETVTNEKIKVKAIAPAAVNTFIRLNEKQSITDGQVLELTKQELSDLRAGTSWKFEEVKETQGEVKA
ncbi:hypothetical protein [uncultured Enterococcus sp.]|uniref:hypothetical protein n=1 Tax=uncultured Enterococcus sp. TaxID=167972 RepID=UPI0025992B3B|nr:hypothetical protein [uncultured Enterococcus sp.]